MKFSAYSLFRNCHSSVTREGLWRPYFRCHFRGSSTQSRQWSTPLAKQLFEAINTTGPIPLATYMRMCLTSDLGGYYMSNQEGQDQFGLKGDFITSPEISQIFGELIAIWFIAEWMAQGKCNKAIEIVELGPGRGTLMNDMLRTFRNFKYIESKIKSIYLIETSPSLRQVQKNLLCGDNPLNKSSIGYHSTSKHMNLPITWTENFRFVPPESDNIPFIVAHEFFDSLPIHAFQTVLSNSFRKTIETPTGEHQFTSKAFRNKSEKKAQWHEMMVTPIKEPVNNSPEFQLTLSKAPTPHSLYLPQISHRYRVLEKIPGSLLEISPESISYSQELARRIGGSKSEPKASPSGAAIILDYGPLDTIPVNSLRGIRSHKLVSPFISPGLVDLSADVDFVALAEAALEASPEVEVHGPVEQASFLLTMGIKERAQMLLNEAVNNDAKRQRVENSCKRLINRAANGMGKVYKAMVIIPKNRGRQRPVGFGGDIEL